MPAEPAPPRRGGFLMSVGALSTARAIALLSQVLVLPLIARYLSPFEFGLAALAMSVTIFANALSDGGMWRSLIRVPIARHTEWSSVFWLLAGIGIVLCGGLAALAWPLTWAFGEPALFWPLLALAPLPLMLSLNAAFHAEMEQRDAFGEIALAEISGVVAGLVAAIWLALAGYGVWALIVQQILLVAIRVVWTIARSRFRPAFAFSRALVGHHLIFGRNILAGSLTHATGEQGASILIGKILGTAELGLFSMAQRFMRLPVFGMAQPFGQVLYVRLTRVQDDPARFRALVLGGTRMLTLVMLPPLVALCAVSGTAFTLVLSETWAPVGPIFTLAVIGTVLFALLEIPAVALTAIGRTGDRFRLLTECAFIWLACAAVAAPFGIEAVAAARSLAYLIALPRTWHYLGPHAAITARAYLGALVPGLAAAVVMAGVILGAEALSGLTGWLWLAVSFALMLAVLGGALGLYRNALRADIAELRA